MANEDAPSEDELGAMLDEEFDDWDEQKESQVENDQHAPVQEAADGQEEGQGEEEAGLDDAAAAGSQDATQQSSSESWGSDADMDTMAEEMLQDMAYPSPEGLAHAAAAADAEAPGSEPAAQDDTPQKRRRIAAATPGNAADAAGAHAGNEPPLLHSDAAANDPACTPRDPAAERPAAHAATASAVPGAAATAAAAAAPRAAKKPAAAPPRAAAAACTHPTFWAGMCVVCGAPEPRDPPPSAATTAPSTAPRRASASAAAPSAPAPPPAHPPTRIKHMHASAHLVLSPAEAERLRQQEVSRLLGSRRLVLVLDLDHTLLNSVRLGDVAPEHLALLQKILDQEAGHPHRLLRCLADKNLWTKLRPFVFDFLEAAKELYELHIYTMGDKHYAAEIRRILDPESRLFSSVISANDSTLMHSKHLDVALVHDRLVVILDDTEQVWPNHAQNLIKVDRYHFFPASLRQWHSAAQSLLEQERDESSSNGTLATCLAVLREVHGSFFGEDGGDGAAAQQPLERRDVRYFLTQRRERVLRGCRLVFSHCWPMSCAAPYGQPLWRMAEALGAECGVEYERETVTHVVAASANTEKVLLARAHGKLVVGPEWLQACFFRWQRVPEASVPPPAGRARGGELSGGGGGGAAAKADDLKLALRAAGGGAGAEGEGGPS